MPDRQRTKLHLYIEGGGQSEAYTSRLRPKTPPPPAQNRMAHANALIREVGEAVSAGRQQIAQREKGVAEGETGFYLEFSVPATERLAVEKLENRQKKIELVAVQQQAADTQTLAATVFVPEASADFFQSRLRAYRDENTARSQRPKNEALISRIDSIRLGVVRSLFTATIYLTHPPSPGRVPPWTPPNGFPRL